ncbi:MAG: hypothetical protein LBD35_05565 [Prevotellaceae bacterium]|jgi:hypothetical protein|nr:hypothetical protein [Prevotellaceae bacterium]
MIKKIKSEGKCLYCGNTYSKSAINRHIATHLAQKVQENKKGISFTVKVEAKSHYIPEASYFLSLWVDGETGFDELDYFLGCIWLQCCGHLSHFRKPYNSVKRDYDGLANDIVKQFRETGHLGVPEDCDEYFSRDDETFSMEEKVKNAFYSKLKIKYEYDFGSTTELTLTVTNRYEIEADERIVLLSRNEPPAIYCRACNERIAIYVCTVHAFNEECVFCEECAKQHAAECPDFEDYAAMTIVNSPRFGICAYNGGTIDTERDGIYGQ